MVMCEQLSLLMEQLLFDKGQVGVFLEEFGEKGFNLALLFFFWHGLVEK
jgi:hypothetical protein